jgi:hypothetical protein
MSGIDLDKLIKTPEEIQKPEQVSRKYHEAQMAKAERNYSIQRRNFESKIWLLQKDVARRGNPEFTKAHEKLKAKFANTLKIRRDLEAKVVGFKENAYRLNLEREFLKKRIEQVFKKEGLMTILAHVECPFSLRKLLQDMQK